MHMHTEIVHNLEFLGHVLQDVAVVNLELAC